MRTATGAVAKLHPTPQESQATMLNATSASRRLCEDYLREQIRRNNEQHVLGSETLIAERLLARGDEMAHVYDEVYPQLCRDGMAWKHFIDRLLSTAAFWSPEKIVEYRQERHELEVVNRDIGKHARLLAGLLEHREELHNRSAFGSGTHCGICDVIENASEHNGLYRSWLKEPLGQLRSQFDLKYWPPIAECVSAIAEDAENAKIEAWDALTEAATKKSRSSKADSVRALRAAFDDSRGNWIGALPEKFRPSDEVMASLVTVLLDLPVDEAVDATYVKNLRHRDREAESEG